MAQSFHEPKRPKNSSDRAIKLKRKRAIEKNFSQDQEAAQKKKKNSDTETEDEATSDIEFEVGGTIKSSRYKHLYSSTFPITFKE